MILTPQQTEELLQIIEKNQVLIVGRQLGPDFLTIGDRELLTNSGVNLDTLYSPTIDTVFSEFHYGLLAEALGQTYVDALSYDQLKEYISGGRYIPLNLGEQIAIQTIKRQTFNDLKKLNGKIFSDVNQTLIDNSLKEQKQFLRDQISTGIEKKQTVTEIAHRIAELTGDWSRDFERIVAYNSHQAFEEGKAAMMIRNAGDKEPIVYKTVFHSACDHCVHLYLTNGVGSQPRLFKLSELRGNGTNIGRKTKDWLATLGPIHPYCRCSLKHLLPGQQWNQKLQAFTSDIPYIPLRKKIRAWIGGQEVYI